MSQPVPPEQHANTWLERLVHYQYLSELLTGRRVLEIGCGSGRGAAHLASVARHVVAVDTSSIELSLSRRAYPRPNLEFVVGEPDRLQLDGGSFDVVLVPELGRWVTRGAFMPELRRMLAPGGLAFFAVRSGDGDGHGGMAYHDLTEYLSQAFPQIRLIGVLPFHGQILAEFDPIDELEPQLDSSLVSEDEAPTHYLAICSDQTIPPLGYAVIQVPLGGTPIGELEGLREKFDRLVEERAEVELKLEEMRAQVADAERRVLEAGREARQELTALRRELREKADRLEARERELQQTRAALEEARSLQHEGERAVDDVVEELKLQMEEQRERAQLELQQARQRLEQHVEGSGRRIKQLEEELREARAGQPVASEGGDGAALAAARNRIEALELALKELREENLALERRARGDEGELVTLRPGEVDDSPLGRRLEREQARAEALEERLNRERERFDRERDRAEAAIQKQLEEHAKLEALNLRAELAERTLAEVRAGLERERQRAEGAERRCDNLVIRIEQGAAELSSLHGRLAELQGLHQSDLWRIDELTGRLRELEARGGAAGAQATGGGLSAELAAAQARIRELEQRLQGSAEAESHVAELEKRMAELEVQNKQYGDVVADLERKLMLADSRVVENARKATNAESKIVQLEVKLKRSEAEAATLSKWAEELRDELKEAQGKSTVRPVTPEPEVAALRNDLREAQARIAELEGRCDRYLKDAETAKATLKEREQALEEALRSADGSLLDELRQLRARAVDIEGLRLELEQARDEADELANQLRDVEQADAELARTRRELEELRQRVRDVDGAAEELEQLRLASVRHREVERELERVRAELEAARIALARAEDEARGATLPEEAGWASWSGEGDEEGEEEEFERYVGAEMEGGELAEGEGEAGWEADERLRVRERQLEALLEGAALHREETERLQAQIAEMDALCEELQGERTALEGRLAEAERRLAEQRTTGQELRDELLRVGRELARAQGELRRCRDERDALAARGGDGSTAGVVQREDLEREVRARQRLEADLQARLRELDEAQRQLRERDRAFDALRSEETAHRAELRDLRRQLLEQRAGDGGRSAVERSLGELAGARAQMAELEGKLRAEAEQLAGLEVQLRGIAAVVEKPT